MTTIILSSCAPPRVVHFSNENMDFSDYKTYRLINYKSDDKSFSEAGMVVFSMLERAIDSSMTARKYKVVEKPDIIVRYEIISTIETQSNNARYDPHLYNSYYYSPPPRYNNTKKITEGVLLIEFRDKKKKKLIWQASLDLKFSKKTTPISVITSAVNRIFTTYLYQAGSNEKRALDE